MNRKAIIEEHLNLSISNPATGELQLQLLVMEVMASIVFDPTLRFSFSLLAVLRLAIETVMEARVRDGVA